MTNEMIERVARAIKNTPVRGVIDEQMTPAYPLESYHAQARAAIEAMREHLIAWAYEHYDEGGITIEVMIDSALSK